MPTSVQRGSRAKERQLPHTGQCTGMKAAEPPLKKHPKGRPRGAGEDGGHGQQNMTDTKGCASRLRTPGVHCSGQRPHFR